MNEEEKEESQEPFELRERFVWKWHPHGWLILILIVGILLLLMKLAE